MSSETPSRESRLSPAAMGALGALLGILLAAAFFLFFGGPGAPAAGGPPGEGGPGGGGPPGFGPAPVDVVRAVEVVAAEPVQLLGTVQPVRVSSVASEVDGLVVEVRVEEGDSVRAGQMLARLRSTTLQEELDGASAALAEARARLVRAESDFERLADLLERDAISRSEYDRAVAERDALEQAVAGGQAEVARLQKLLERSVVVAPFAGEVTAVHVELGEWIGRGEDVTTLVDLTEVEITVQVAERFVPAVETGFPVSVTFDALSGGPFQGRVTAVVPEAVPQARTFPVLVRIPNPDGRIKGGMAARVRAQLGSRQPAVLVPKDAITRTADQAFVFLLRPAEGGSGAPGGQGAAGDPGPADAASSSGGAGEGAGMTGTLERVPVETGPARGAWLVTYGGVEAGDLVVVRGNERAFPGQPARVAQIQEPPVPEADPDSPIAVDPRQREATR